MSPTASLFWVQIVQLGQTSPGALYLQAFSMARNVTGTMDSGYAIYLDIAFADGTHEWGFHLPFTTGTHTWERVEAYIDREKPIATIEVCPTTF
eukprot:scaffold7676_cov511-Prasinococcus_capsulatus_cf.AAC.2